MNSWVPRRNGAGCISAQYRVTGRGKCTGSRCHDPGPGGSNCSAFVFCPDIVCLPVAAEPPPGAPGRRILTARGRYGKGQLSDDVSASAKNLTPPRFYV